MRKQRVKIILTSAVASFLTAAAMSLEPSAAEPEAAAGAADPKAPAPPPVRVVRADTAGAASTLELPVVAEPMRHAELHARVSGIVGARHVDIGDRVEAGQVLAVIDTPEVEREHERAIAAHRQATARRALAQSNLARAEALIDRGFVSRSMLDEKRAEAAVAAADEAVAVAEIRRLDELLRMRQVRAPFAGTVTLRGVERGNLVSPAPSATPLFTIAQTDRLRVVAQVPQTALARLAEGAPVTLMFDELPGQAIPAAVTRSSNSVESRAGTARVEFVIDNRAYRLPTGGAGKVQISHAGDPALLLLPTNALVTRSGAPHVAVVEGGRVRFRKVETARDLGSVVEVRGGLARSAQVVLNPNALLRDGDPVAVVGEADSRRAG